jgi:hypothetical protein
MFSISTLIIITFIVTAFWDVCLRILSENYYKLPNILQYDFVKFLIPYFKYHTILSAALLAGFIGAVTQALILSIIPFPDKIYNIKNLSYFILISFICSGLFGFIMKFTKLFPILDRTYYKNLGTVRSVYHDGISGVIVQITILLLLTIYNGYK